MTTLPILYSFRRCPYAIRARLALKHAGIDVAVREVSLKHKPAAMLALSPKGTVPVLQLAEGRVLEESLDIMDWALAQNTPTLPDRQPESPDTTIGPTLIALNDGPFKQLLDRYKYADPQSAPLAETCRDEAVELLIAPLNQRLAHAPYLLGEIPTRTDMAIVPFIRQFAGVDPDWFAAAPFVELQHWLSGWIQSPLFVSIMAKHHPWQPGDPLTLL